jgi:drug/metabolite transporter (DMT)-like permease
MFMVTIFASLSALAYGSADFSGGMSARNNSATSVVAWSHAIGILVALIVAPLIGSSSVTVGDIFWGIAAGLSGAIGVGILYRGLASGLAAVVSPVAALTGATLPVLFAVLAGERPELLTWSGMALALPAILLLSSEKREKRDHVLQSLRLGFLSGCGFSGFFILIAQTGEGSGMWPLLVSRMATAPFFFMITAIQKRPLFLKKGSLRFALFAGTLDLSANIFYLLAARTGFMVTAVIITALYPAPTVLLQRIFRGEKLNVNRIIGLILAIIGAALIGIGG